VSVLAKCFVKSIIKTLDYWIDFETLADSYVSDVQALVPELKPNMSPAGRVPTYSEAWPSPYI
jgi:hypothetical protein